MKIVAIIPARGGSKGLLNKNIIELENKPLIAWSIEASLKSKYITKTIVSSDNDKILNIAKQYGACIQKRPNHLAEDITPTEPVIYHVLQHMEYLEEYDYLILLQPTSPLRDESDIDASIELLIRENATALISVKEIDNKLLKAFKLNKHGFLEGIANNEYPFMRRQDLPKVMFPNGAIYIIKIKDFLENHKLFTKKTSYYLMDDIKSLDIDVIEDLELAKKYIQIN